MREFTGDELARRLELVRAAHPYARARRPVVVDLEFRLPRRPGIEVRTCAASSCDPLWCQVHGSAFPDGALACRRVGPNA